MVVTFFALCVAFAERIVTNLRPDASGRRRPAVNFARNSHNNSVAATGT
jgi:hypothetical protein